MIAKAVLFVKTPVVSGYGRFMAASSRPHVAVPHSQVQWSPFMFCFLHFRLSIRSAYEQRTICR